MKLTTPIITDSDRLYDLIKSRQTFYARIIECTPFLFGPMYDVTERNSIVEVEGDIPSEYIYPLLDRDDALYLFNFYNFANEYSLYCEEEQMKVILSYCDICHKDDLSLKRKLSYNGEAYQYNYVYLDNRTSKIYDTVILEDGDYVYLYDSVEGF